MARRTDVQYVRFYTTGSAARKLEPQEKPKRKAPRPQPQHKIRPDTRKVIRIDPISLCAMAVAAVLLVTMAIGMIELGSVNAETERMESYVSQLRAENTQLHAEYSAGYDLDEVEQMALEMGFVPVDQVEHVTIHVEPPQPEQEMTAWQEFCAAVRELFA